MVCQPPSLSRLFLQLVRNLTKTGLPEGRNQYPTVRDKHQDIIGLSPNLQDRKCQVTIEVPCDPQED